MKNQFVDFLFERINIKLEMISHDEIAEQIEDLEAYLNELKKLFTQGE